MDLKEAKKKLSKCALILEHDELATFDTFETPHGILVVDVSARLRRACRKQGVWNSNAMLTAIKNCVYGYDPVERRSRGGADGIFLVDRDHQPANSMMRKIYDKFLDKPDSLIDTICESWKVQASDLLAVRVVSHHMRLLGVLAKGEGANHLILVDCDREKG